MVSLVLVRVIRDLSVAAEKLDHKIQRRDTMVSFVLVRVIRDLSVTPAEKLDQEIHEETRSTFPWLIRRASLHPPQSPYTPAFSRIDRDKQK